MKTEMKRYNNLFEKIISMENLELADKKARRGKKSYGIKIFDRNRAENLRRLHEDLKAHRFHTSEYKIEKIFEPKERDIYKLPYYPDRIVHHAIMNILEPIWTSVFIKETYSCIKGRGIHKAAADLKKAMKDVKGTKYCLKIDIRKFYPTINHIIMKEIVRKKIKCEGTLWLLDDIIDSVKGIKGLALGNLLSQFLANLYLSYFDHDVKEIKKVKYYYRYADDMTFFSDSKEFLHELLKWIKEYMKTLDLELKGNEQIFPIAMNRFDKSGRGLDFVGYVFYHKQTMLRKGIKKNFCRKASKLNKKENITEKEYKQCLCSWIGWAKHCNSKRLTNKILKYK